MTASALFEVGLSCVSYFGFGDEPKLVKVSVLAVMLLAGLFSAVLDASSSVAREIRSGTALAVLAKPVSRPQFLLANIRPGPLARRADLRQLHCRASGDPDVLRCLRRR